MNDTEINERNLYMTGLLCINGIILYSTWQALCWRTSASRTAQSGS